MTCSSMSSMTIIHPLKENAIQYAYTHFVQKWKKYFENEFCTEQINVKLFYT